jgi:hypothetical protein
MPRKIGAASRVVTGEALQPALAPESESEAFFFDELADDVPSESLSPVSPSGTSQS